MSEHEETVYAPAWFCGVVVIIAMVIAYSIGRIHATEASVPTPQPTPDLSQLATRSDVQACEAQMHKYMLRIDTALARSVVVQRP